MKYFLSYKYKYRFMVPVLFLVQLLVLAACSDGISDQANASGLGTGAAVGGGSTASATRIITTSVPQNSPTASTPPPGTTPFNWGGRGKAWDQPFFSPVLQRDMSYMIYLPPAYFSNPNERFPVLYMLHGLSGSNREWIDYGILPNADDMIAAGQVQPFIIVLPAGEQGYWMNQANNGPRWADYVAYDVVGHVDANYRTLADPQNRAIGGHSMGGHGSLQIGFNYPEVFGIIGSHSPSLRTIEQELYFFGDQAHYNTIDPVTLAKKVDLSNYKIWLDVGTGDTDWRSRAEELYGILSSRGANLIWHEWPGIHGGEYWIAHCKDYINFYSNAFSR